MTALLQAYTNKIKDWSLLPEPQLLIPIRAGGWSMRNIVGHIYYWDRFLIETVIPAAKSGKPVRHWPHPDIYNHSALASIEGRRARWVLEQGTKIRSILLDQLTDMEPGTPISIPDNPELKTLDDVIKLFDSHDKHHIQHIEQYLEHGMQKGTR